MTGVVIIAGLICVLSLTYYLLSGNAKPAAAPAGWQVPAPMDAERAIATIETLCGIGRRISGSPGMKLQQDWLRKQFESVDGKVSFQEFKIRHPQTGAAVSMQNMLIHYGPEQGERLLVAAHYDTRPFPDFDTTNPTGLFLGANDGASGAAMMLELAHALAGKPPTLGVDLVLMDGEEFIFDPDRDAYFHGSTQFAREYSANKANLPYKYREGVLVDMIGDRDLELYYEVNSWKFASDLTKKIWNHADRLRIKEFVPRLRHEVRDDHLPLNKISQIPTCDIIDFDYPSIGRRGVNYWHTTEDLPNKCSGDSVCKVAAVLLRWIDTER